MDVPGNDIIMTVPVLLSVNNVVEREREFTYTKDLHGNNYRANPYFILNLRYVLLNSGIFFIDNNREKTVGYKNIIKLQGNHNPYAGLVVDVKFGQYRIEYEISKRSTHVRTRYSADSARQWVYCDYILNLDEKSFIFQLTLIRGRKADKTRHGMLYSINSYFFRNNVNNGEGKHHNDALIVIEEDCEWLHEYNPFKIDVFPSDQRTSYVFSFDEKGNCIDSFILYDENGVKRIFMAYIIGCRIADMYLKKNIEYESITPIKTITNVMEIVDMQSSFEIFQCI